MRVRLRFGVTLRIERDKPEEPVQFEHRDTEAYVEPGPPPGFGMGFARER